MKGERLRNYQRFAEETACQAGAFLKRHLGKVKRVSCKGRMNLVTDIDTECERLIIDRISRSFPDHQLLSEEKGHVNSGQSEFRWVIDPLDGTTNYVHSFPFFCVSIALLKTKQAILGVVYDPLRDELFSACKGQGAYLNQKRIRPSNIRNLKRSLLATGFPYKFGKLMRRNVNNFINFMMKAQAVRRAGSAALDLCYVASARFDGFWELDLHPWDTAAGALLVEEAGGRVSTFEGKDFDCFKKEIVASNSKIHNQMLEVLE